MTVTATAMPVPGFRPLPGHDLPPGFPSIGAADRCPLSENFTLSTHPGIRTYLNACYAGMFSLWHEACFISRYPHNDNGGQRTWGI